MVSINEKYARLDTANKTLLLRIFGDNVSVLHFGSRIAVSEEYESYERREWAGTDERNFARNLLSHTGEGGTLEYLFIPTDSEGNFHTRLSLKSVEAVDGDLFDDTFPHSRDKAATLRITYEDKVRGMELSQYISIFDDCDAFVFHTAVTNLSGRDLRLHRLMSLQLDFFGDSAEIHTYDGAWARERFEHSHTVSDGIFVNDSKCGFSSNKHNPFVYLTTPHDGVIGSNLIYSGNHKEILECDGFGRVRFLSGISDYMMNYGVQAGETFHSPECVVAPGDDIDEVTSIMHDFTIRHIVRPNMRSLERPVLANNWEATYFGFTGEKLLSMAELAAGVGVELFVLDDGWFGCRDNDRTSLGDWFDYTAKTGGIRQLADAIRAKGVKFGIWVEPEMISEDSELYRAHPEYAMTVPGYEPTRRRNQLVLDMANDEVREYIFGVLCQLFDLVQPEYVKWDCNRNLTDVYSPTLTHQGEYFHRYMLSLYRLLSDLTNKYPNILFEGCASGGNRFDLGMAYYFPQSWCSDDTDARMRCEIQHGTFVGYHQSLSGSHVSASPNHQTGWSTSMEDRFNIAAAGAFGYELDLTALSEDELAVMKAQISYYKQHRALLQFGRMSQLEREDGNCGWIVVAPDYSEAMATVVLKELQFVRKKALFRLKGLDPDATYTVTERPQANQKDPPRSFTATGDVLMHYGVDLGDIFWHNDRVANSNSVSTGMFYLKKINNK